MFFLDDPEQDKAKEQPVSIYKYFQVDGLDIRENWLSQYSKNVVEYRQKLFKAMSMAQEKYLERKGERRVHNQRENTVEFESTDDFLTVNPRQPSLALNKRKIVKDSRGTLKRPIERYFVIDNQQITFFKGEREIEFQKNAKLEGAFAFIEVYSDYRPSAESAQWHDRRCEFRVQIGLPARQLHPVYFYTNDLNEAKLLAARIYISSTTKKPIISDLIRKISMMEVVFRFQQVWRLIFKVYEKRLLKMISFQILGINLNELATTAWLQREKLFKFWTGQVLKREKIPFLRSTFRYGQIKPQLDPSLYKSSLMVREQILKLVRAFKNRRLQRHSAIQSDIRALLEEEYQGASCNQVIISITDLNQPDQQFQLPYNQCTIKVENNKFLTIQNVQDMQQNLSLVDFYEKNPPIKFQLEQISCIATDINFTDKRQIIDEYTIKVFGRVLKEFSDQQSPKNITSHELGLDVLRQINQDRTLYQIKIISIELPISFAKRFSLKADLRVKLRQGRFQDQLDQSFYLNSRTYRISVPPGKDKGRMVIKGQDYTFTVDKLNQFNPQETFRINVILQRNNVPVTQFMKEFLYEEEFKSDVMFLYEDAQNLEVRCADEKGNKIKVKFSITTIQNQDVQIQPNEREGLRLLIGRYVIYQKRVALLKAINKDNTVDLQNLSTGTVRQNVKMKHIKMIERAGVNIYNLRNMPLAVLNSNYLWTIEFKTRNKRLVNLISSGIQNRQTFNSFNQRAYSRDKKRDIEGNILISVLETLDLKLPDPQKSNLYIKITVQRPYQMQEQIFQTPVIRGSSKPSWINPNSPNGFIVNLGTFLLEEIATIKFQLLNKAERPLQANPQMMSQQLAPVQDQVIGQLDLKSTDFIDIEKFGGELCLILEGKEIQYSFLVIQSLFVPTNVTRIEYQLLSDQSIFLSPEHYFHYQYLQKSYEIDENHYSIPISKFNPNYMEKMSQVSIQKSPLLLELGTEAPDNKSSPAIAYSTKYGGKLCSLEEMISSLLKQKNVSRPNIEEGVLLFKYLWKHRVLKSRQVAFEQLQGLFWTRFLADIGFVAQQKPFALEIKDEMFLADGDVSLIDYEDVSYKLPNLGGPDDNLIGWLKNNIGGTQNPQLLMPKPQPGIKYFPLMFSRIWEDEDSQTYADTYYLIQAGIPPHLRVKIWQDLLSIELLAHEELRVFQRKHQASYDPQKSLYQNYKNLALKHDCLAFRQIDEDIEAFEFPGLYAENLGPVGKVVRQKEEKRQMRNILRVLVLWSRNKKNEGKVVSFSYTKGLMKILQRLITIADEEQSFWILNGMVRMIPRLFSTDESCLMGGRISVMRNEMTAFKAVLRENLPNICDKLRHLGLPVDYLIYDSITSFYAQFFSSDVVLRLWDLIIFNLSNKYKALKKRSLWYFMAPAYWILREKQNSIMNAQSIQEVIDIYNNGSAITYNPDWIVNDLKNLIQQIFVTRFSTSGQQNKSGLFGFLGNQNQVQDNQKAKNLEETRKKYEDDLSLIFNNIEEENKQIGNLLQLSNFGAKVIGGGRGNQTKPQEFLDFNRWKSHIMRRFKRVASSKSSPSDELQKSQNLDLSKVNIYLHKILNLVGFQSFKIRVIYGNIAEDGSFQSVEERFDDEEVFQQEAKVERFFEFEYLSGYNHMKIEVIQGNLSLNQAVDCLCDLIIDMRELNSNRFIKKHFQMRNDHITNTSDSYRYPFSVFVVSFFLQTHTIKQLEVFNQKRNVAMSQFINSIRRKLPDRIDIFNKQSETEFVEQMQKSFQRIIKEEFQALKCFLPPEIARNTINDNFNYVDEGEGSDFGNISISNLQYLVKNCFFSEWVPHLDGIYKIFVKEQTGNGLQQQSLAMQKHVKKDDDDGNLSDALNEETNKQTFVNHTQDLHAKNMEHKDAAKKFKLLQDEESSDGDMLRIKKSGNNQLPFSLRNFLVSLVLMSHCTTLEKFDLLYDLFDWRDGTAVTEGLDLNSLNLLIKTLFERNLYYWPSHELCNLVEMSFDLGVSSVYQARWTASNARREAKVITMKELLSNPEQIGSDDFQQYAIDVTEELQETLNSYQRMFGNKIIDFNYDSSAFKKIATLIKGGQQMLEITNKTLRQGQNYKLIIYYQVSGERYMFEVAYAKEGVLMRQSGMREKDDIDDYLKRNINKLYLQGRSKGVSKYEFMTKTQQIPFLHDLVRVETLYRDRLQSTLAKKTKFSKELVVLVNEDEYLIIFRFQSLLMQNLEGELQKLDEHTFRVMMMPAHDEDVISDLRERIILALKGLQVQIGEASGTLNIEEVVRQVEGKRDFMFRDAPQVNKRGVPAIQQSQTEWRKVQEFTRLVDIARRADEQQTQNQVVFKLDFSRGVSTSTKLTQATDSSSSSSALQIQSQLQREEEEQRDLAGFDCYTLYRHADMSYEWRLCKIMQKEPIIDPMMNHQPDLMQLRQPKNYYYWIEFLHHRKLGQKLWLKRRREELLMSARYAREQQRNYDQESLRFVRDTYREAFNEAATIIGQQ